ncbi:MAG: hypothetical protein HC897_01240 [Thermoanaerobaculia bacterium]|nr:hypothetical protein [Thermoanaerobaculia bacterium]
MAIRRSNPWPALADLFAALLVATFAGLIVMDFVAKGAAAAGADATTLEGQVAKLGEELAKANSQVEKLGTDLAQANGELLSCEIRATELANEKSDLEEQLARVRQEGDQRQARLDHFEAQVRKGGIDPPPCMLIAGRPQPLVEVTILSGGLLEVSPLELGTFGQLAGEIPGYRDLRTTKPIARESLASIARQAHAWGRSTQNSLGYECVFYAQIVIETQSVEELAKTLTYVNEYFYTQNPTDIRAFYRREGR